MAGGTFTTLNKVRPGAYVNFQSAEKARGGIGASGTIAMTLCLDWGKDGFNEITAQTDTFVALGRNLEEPELFPLKEALKSAERVLLYNVADTSSHASSTVIGSALIKAKYKGKLGNQIKIVVVENLDDTYTVFTYFRNALQDKQTVELVENLLANDFVTFEGAGALEENSGVNLSMGTTAEPTAECYINYLKELELQDFYAFTLNSTDLTLKDTAISYCKKWRDREGKKCVLVLADVNADYEGVISVDNGVILSSGQVLAAQDTLPFVTGAVASAGISRSLTYTIYPDAIDIMPRLTQSEVEKALQTGKFVFTRNHNSVVVEQDINTLVTFTKEKSKDFRKNKIVRVLDAFNNELIARYAESYIGKVTNNQDGRDLLKKDILSILEQFKSNNAIEEYSDEDVIVLEGAEKDVVIVNVGFVVTDAMEKLYATVILK